MLMNLDMANEELFYNITPTMCNKLQADAIFQDELIQGIAWGVNMDGMPLAMLGEEGMIDMIRCEAAFDVLYDYEVLGFDCPDQRAFLENECGSDFVPMTADYPTHDDIEAQVEGFIAENMMFNKVSTESNSQWGYYAVGGVALVGGLWYLAGKNAQKGQNEEFLLQ